MLIILKFGIALCYSKNKECYFCETSKTYVKGGI